MRSLIVWFDRFLCRVYGVFQYTDDPECIFRLQLTNARHDIRLSDGTVVRKGEPVLGLHFWNEQLPSIGLDGADVAWGARAARMTIRSLRTMAKWIREHPGLSERRVIGGANVLIDPRANGGSAQLIRRLGFDIFPFRNSLGRFGEFWENLYTWSLMWTYNKASVRHQRLLRLRRTEVWMSVDTLVRNFSRG
jgi:hypothetical protein